ncbi:hypothetical protein [Roseomonas rosulenta]|uniref:hypothetical protein n=1 Tax=Roseomonas rosulenta TaxID=2748667 RepID=UPI0018DF856B|nr:hypothetical protein [Roseomonas rosulenta]
MDHLFARLPLAKSAVGAIDGACMRYDRFAVSAMAVTCGLSFVPPASAKLPSGLYFGAGLGISWLYEGNQPVAPMANSGLSTPSDHFRMGWEPGFIGDLCETPG